MGSMLAFLLVIAGLFYLSVIYTSEAILLLAFSSAVLFVCLYLYLFVTYGMLLGKVLIPIPVLDAGKKAAVQIRLRNKGILPIFKAELFIEVWNSFEQRKKVHRILVSGIFRGENQTEFFLGFEYPGNYEVLLKKVRIYAPAGWCYLNKRFPSKKNVQVLPELSEMPVLLSAPVKNFFGDSDIYDEERPGYDNSEVFEIRPYAAGDKLQSIHWKLSAKSGELMVKENSLPKACPVVLFLDYHIEKKKRKEAFGNFLELGASLSYSLMDAGCPHYVAWYEEQVQDVMRIRVDTEEGFYLFLSCYLKEQGKKSPEDIKLLYDEKYKSERYLYSVRVTEKLSVYKNEERICEFQTDNLKDQLGGVEIVL